MDDLTARIERALDQADVFAIGFPDTGEYQHEAVKLANSFRQSPPGDLADIESRLHAVLTDPPSFVQRKAYENAARLIGATTASYFRVCGNGLQLDRHQSGSP